VGQQVAIAAAVRGRTALPVVVGLVDGRNKAFIEQQADFLYVDHGYYGREHGWGVIRVIRGAHHLTRTLERPADRRQRFGVRIAPWRPAGESVVVIPPSSYYESIYGLQEWLPTMLAQLPCKTSRRVVVKSRKGNLLQFLVDEKAHAVVCAMSVAGVEAALAGWPVFSTPRCASWPVNCGSLDDIDRPQRPEREAWANALAYATWHLNELDSIGWRDYNYQLKERDESSDNGP
jgi:hypothetical protein